MVALAGGWVNKMSLRVVCGNTERTARNPEHSHTRARACIVTQAGRRARAHPGHNLAGEGRWRQARCGVFALGACLRADINIARTRTRACARAHTHTHTNSGQDLGNGLWSMLSELLPRAHSLMVSFFPPLSLPSLSPSPIPPSLPPSLPLSPSLYTSLPPPQPTIAPTLSHTPPSPSLSFDFLPSPFPLPSLPSFPFSPLPLPPRPSSLSLSFPPSHSPPSFSPSVPIFTCLSLCFPLCSHPLPPSLSPAYYAFPLTPQSLLLSSYRYRVPRLA